MSNIAKYHKKLVKKGSRIWQYQEAKAKLSEVMDLVQKEGMQTIVRKGKEEYIIITKKQYEETTRPNSSLIEFFLEAPYPEIELDISRNKDLIREFDL